MRTALAALALTIAAAPALAQPRCADAPPETEKGDLDGDGAPDCWTRCWDGGSGAGGVFVKLRPACGAHVVELDTHAGFGAFVDRHPVPGVSPAMRRGLAGMLFGAEALRRLPGAKSADPPMDGSFRWLLDAHPLKTADPAPFARVVTFTPRWAAGPARVPPNQVIVHGDDLVPYFAHNHARRPLKPAGRCGDLAVHTTAHGVTVTRVAAPVAHAWVFITTDARKLRWPSIDGIACRDGLIVATVDVRRGAPYRVVIDPAAGRIGRVEGEGDIPWEAARARLGISAKP